MLEEVDRLSYNSDTMGEKVLTLELAQRINEQSGRYLLDQVRVADLFFWTPIQQMNARTNPPRLWIATMEGL